MVERSYIIILSIRGLQGPKNTLSGQRDGTESSPIWDCVREVNSMMGRSWGQMFDFRAIDLRGSTKLLDLYCHVGVGSVSAFACILVEGEVSSLECIAGELRWLKLAVVDTCCREKMLLCVLVTAGLGQLGTVFLTLGICRRSVVILPKKLPPNLLLFFTI